MRLRHGLAALVMGTAIVGIGTRAQQEGLVYPVDLVAASGGGVTDDGVGNGVTPAPGFTGDPGSCAVGAGAAKRSRGVSPIASSAPASICPRKSANFSAGSAMARCCHVRNLCIIFFRAGVRNA